MLVMNTSDVPIPNRGVMKKQDIVRWGILKRRAHLQYHDRHTDLSPLSQKERKEYEEYELMKNDELSAKWGPIEIQFAPFGEEGCLWELRGDIAVHMAEQHPSRLVALTSETGPEWYERLREKLGGDEELQAFRVRVLHPSKIPSRGMLGFGADDLRELSDNPLGEELARTGMPGMQKVVDRGDGTGTIGLAGAGWMAQVSPRASDEAGI